MRGLGFEQMIDDVDCRGEEHGVPALAGVVANGRRQVCFSGAGGPEELPRGRQPTGCGSSLSCSAPPAGTRTSISTPCPSLERTLKSPPTLRARARIPIIPMPRRSAPAAGKPRPSSRIERRTSPPRESSVTMALQRARMARQVGKRLLCQAEQVRFGLIGQAAGNGGLEFRLYAGAMREAFAKPA